MSTTLEHPPSCAVPLTSQHRASAPARATGGHAGRSFRSPAPCRPGSPIEAALNLLDGRWKPWIVWCLFWEPRSFSELLRRMRGVTRKALRRELQELERQGFVRQEPDPQDRTSVRLALTPSGESLKPLAATLYELGLRVQLAGWRERGPAPSLDRLMHTLAR